MPTMEHTISIYSLSKAYGTFKALEDLDLHIQPGEIFGFLGPNGAGKTTTINLLMGLIRPTSGTCAIGGFNPHSVEENEILSLRRIVGYVPDATHFPEYLTAYETLEMAGRMHGLSPASRADRLRTVIAQHGLEEVIHQYPTSYSLGMRRKLALAHAQIHDPKIYILDEPTNGLDPYAAREIKVWMTSMAEAGKTILLSTHLLDMAERYCHRVAILNKGRLITVAHPQELKRQLQEASLEDAFFKMTEQ
ncbi:MAG: ABC transporter ATP-binding protein [Acidobacteria bacterium]|nr:ABC transporter ATP-binding protein [Acidobacteriota bacterium]